MEGLFITLDARYVDNVESVWVDGWWSGGGGGPQNYNFFGFGT